MRWIKNVVCFNVCVVVVVVAAGCMGGDQSYCISNSDIIFAVIPYHTSDGRDNMALFLDTHRDILPGKSVVDLSNLFYRTPPVDFDTEKYKSGLEFHRDVVNDSSVSLVAGYKVINNTSLLTTRQGVEICGDDKAKAQLSEIIEATGWWVIDRGGVESAPLLEPKGPLRERPDDPREIEHLEDAISMADDTMP